MDIVTEYRMYVAALHSAIGNQTRLQNLLNTFPDPSSAWNTGSSELGSLLGWTPAQQEEFAVKRQKLNVEEYWEEMLQQGINLLLPSDARYPENLRNIYDPPGVLYHKGSLTDFPREAVAIVGMRKATSYGKMVAQNLAKELTARGILVVSGLARGIDSAAHRGALELGSTIGVLGCGLDVVYPRENARLQEEVAAHGAVLSEYPPGSPPEAWHFPARNRIISGLSLGVVVIEAEEKSGTLITVDSALEQGREVFAVPGDIFRPGSKGTNRLLKQGAVLVTGCQDILDGLALDTLFPGQPVQGQGSLQISRHEEKILQLLEMEALSIDELALRSKLDTATVMAALTYLEIKGLVKQLGGQNFQRVPVFS